MADARIISIDNEILTATPKMFTVSGYVTQSGTPVSRKIVVFRDSDMNTSIASTLSDSSDGNFSLELNGNTNDKFTLVCVGLESENENSKIFAHIAGD